MLHRPTVKVRVRQKPNSKGVRLGHHANSSPRGYPTRGMEFRSVIDYQEAQDSTTPMGRR